jgi:hypothetical protein
MIPKTPPKRNPHNHFINFQLMIIQQNQHKLINQFRKCLIKILILIKKGKINLFAIFLAKSESCILILMIFLY